MNLVSIVGAGPGDLKLMTLKAIEAVKEAEVLLWTDSLIPPEITKIAPENCELIKTSSLILEEISEILIKKAKQGKKVVRLHDGDPCLYGAISEQICGLAEAGINVEVVPGISAYQATSSALKKELTIPSLVQTIVLTRTPGRTGMPNKESLEKVASLQATLCLYLSARHVDEAQETLLKYYSPETPVAIGYRVSWKDEWLDIVDLKDLASVSKKQRLIRTTIYIVSPALKATNERSKLYQPVHKHLFRQK